MCLVGTRSKLESLLYIFPGDPMRGLNTAVSALSLCGLLFAIPITQTSRKPATAPLVWPGWGGPRGNFTSEAKGLANTWPTEGPKQLWSRPLGEGHSSIISDGERLYTMSALRAVRAIPGKLRRL